MTLKIPPGDLDTQMRPARPPGGQHAGVAEQIIRVTHKPTGLSAEASAADHRSQLQARDAAMFAVARKVTLARLAAVWDANPELRLGQLIENVFGQHGADGTRYEHHCVYHLDDGEFISRIEEFYRDGPVSRDRPHP